MCIKMRTPTLYIHHYPPRYSWLYMVYTWSILYYLSMKFRFLSTQQISAITVFEVGAYRSPPGQWEFSRRGPAQPLCLEFVQGLVRLSWCKGSMGLLYFVVYIFFCSYYGVLTERWLAVVHGAFLATYDHFETTWWLVTMREPNDDILSLSIWFFEGMVQPHDARKIPTACLKDSKSMSDTFGQCHDSLSPPFHLLHFLQLHQWRCISGSEVALSPSLYPTKNGDVWTWWKTLKTFVV